MTKKEDDKKPAVKATKAATPKAVKQAAEKLAKSTDDAVETVVHDVKKTSKKSYVKYLALIVLVLVGAGLILSRGDQLIAEPFVRAQLGNVSDNLASQAALSGDIARLTHGDITVSGGMFNKQATIKDLTLDYTARLPFGNEQRTVVSTSEAVVMADQIADNTIVIKFPKPFTIIRNAGAPLEITFADKPTYKFTSEDNIEDHVLDVPNTFVLGLNPGSDDPVGVTAVYAKNPTFTRHVDHNKQTRSSVIDVRDIKLTSNVESNEIMVGAFTLDTKEQAVAEGKRQFKNDMAVTNLVIKQLDVSDGPYNLHANLAGDYTVSMNEASGKTEMNQVRMDVSNLEFSSNHYGIKTKGNFNRDPEDQMIFGAADIAITGLDKLKQSELVAVKDEALKNKVIALITGNPDPTATEANFTLKREKHGTFYVGQTTFENLIGVVVTHALSETQQQKLPQ